MYHNVFPYFVKNVPVPVDGFVGPPEGPGLLVDDLVDSGWTLTEVGRLLRRDGAGPIYPVALGSTSARAT